MHNDLTITVQITAADRERHAPLTPYMLVQYASKTLRRAHPDAQLYVSWADNHYGETEWTRIRVRGGEAANLTSIVREDLEAAWECRALLERLSKRRNLRATTI